MTLVVAKIVASTSYILFIDGLINYLYLHPTSDVVTGEVSSDHVQHVDRERPEGNGLLVLVVPRAPKFPGLIPDLLHLWVVLDDDDVLEVSARSGVSPISI